MGVSDSDINQFYGRYRFLSNFYPAPLRLWGQEFPTSEHAYQYAKIVVNQRHLILSQETPGKAKRISRDLDVIDSWELKRFNVMDTVVNAKFDQNESLRDLLLSTGDAHLREGNTWGDTYWGCILVNGAWHGRNKLGLILMSVRSRYNLFGNRTE